MNRKQAMQIICKNIKNEIIISANGFISRDLFSILDKNTNFYMIGSMGLASSIGLGIALKNPKKKIIVFDGDGNILMNLGSLVTIGYLQPKNLMHIIFDNQIHESTGSQPTATRKIKIENIAKESNYKVYTINSKKELENKFTKCKKSKGPILILIKIKKDNTITKRITLKPAKIKTRFTDSI